MPTDRKVLVLEAEQLDALIEAVDQACEDPDFDRPVFGATQDALRSALDKEGTEREEWRVISKRGEVLVHSAEAAEISPGELDVILREYHDNGIPSARIQSRTITTFEDGAEHRSAWRDLEGEDG